MSTEVRSKRSIHPISRLPVKGEEKRGGQEERNHKNETVFQHPLLENISLGRKIFQKKICKNTSLILSCRVAGAGRFGYEGTTGGFDAGFLLEVRAAAAAAKLACLWPLFPSIFYKKKNPGFVCLFGWMDGW